ncbi:ExbD/TolR family protein [Capnocytophaga catalasegens]|uniref:Biopolymer transporter ExbD n=1 Tax=Capnocytophaga catalasegens TaxID=1004260 RepID=A0AAV5B0S1_9FLAO|nr:biopolymer transporter ExbD [Capnocytophaga catalasegens]GIZ15449.1 biopolymer transporter ExbD [Capnocytophaga catalasegens]GJM51037.1 biopolymer transporter ExbD [Capnocytophaga catalasegens]GJM52222.1 biopolymer transporter ExbD [Capnocytophaga catalasegens]
MAKFTKKKSGELPPVSTASLPDIVFMLLFFFMTVTQMKNSDLMVYNEVPTANQVQKLDKKDPVMYVFAGEPLERFQAKYGKNAKLQINDKFAEVKEVAPFVLKYKDGLRQELQDIFITALKVDKDTKMGIVSDVKEELRNINALKITYITKEGNAIEALGK